MTAIVYLKFYLTIFDNYKYYTLTLFLCFILGSAHSERLSFYYSILRLSYTTFFHLFLYVTRQVHTTLYAQTVKSLHVCARNNKQLVFSQI